MIPYSVSLSHGNPDSLFLTTRRRHKGDLSLPSAKTTATRDNQVSSISLSWQEGDTKVNLTLSRIIVLLHIPLLVIIMLLFYLVNDHVNRLKEILGTVPPACCMELPYFHGKVFFLKSDIGWIFVYRFLLEYVLRFVVSFVLLIYFYFFGFWESFRLLSLEI